MKEDINDLNRLSDKLLRGVGEALESALLTRELTREEWDVLITVDEVETSRAHTAFVTELKSYE